MRIGPLRHRITLQTLTQGRDAYGGLTEAWTDSVSVWASIERTGGSEPFSGSQPQSVTNIKMYIRKRDLDSRTWRVKDGTKVYNIVAILPDNKNEYSVLICQEASYEQG